MPRGGRLERPDLEELFRRVARCSTARLGGGDGARSAHPGALHSGPDYCLSWHVNAGATA
eukprot:7680211-Pyramimonas_sp.AAC.1